MRWGQVSLFLAAPEEKHGSDLVCRSFSLAMWCPEKVATRSCATMRNMVLTFQPLGAEPNRSLYTFPGLGYLVLGTQDTPRQWVHSCFPLWLQATSVDTVFSLWISRTAALYHLGHPACSWGLLIEGPFPIANSSSFSDFIFVSSTKWKTAGCK